MRYLRQELWHVQIVQDAVDVGGFDDGNDERLDGVAEGVVTELSDVGDAFECFHGGSPN